jgi:hypothetical protein
VFLNRVQTLSNTRMIWASFVVQNPCIWLAWCDFFFNAMTHHDSRFPKWLLVGGPIQVLPNKKRCDNWNSSGLLLPVSWKTVSSKNIKKRRAYSICLLNLKQHKVRREFFNSYWETGRINFVSCFLLQKKLNLSFRSSLFILTSFMKKTQKF